MGSTTNSRMVIRATGSYLPGREVTSRELGARLGLSEDEIVRRTGIVSRRWAEPFQSTADLAIEAGKHALKEAAVDPASVDRVLVATTSPDMLFPSTACLVQRGLGMHRAAAMDISASCSGFLAALSMARAVIGCGDAGRVLIVCADVKSRFLDLNDPSTAIIFGDGAGAAIVERAGSNHADAGGRVDPVHLATDGGKWRWVHMPAGGSRLPMSAETVAAGLHTLKMDGIPLFRMAVTRFTEVVRGVLADHRLAVDDVACFVFHQANLRILEAVAARLGIPEEKVATTLTAFGNTSSASLPVTLDAAVRAGRIGPGDNVVLATFGGGITWGACRVVWGG